VKQEYGGRTEMEYGIAPAGYRLPADVWIGRVVLQVADLERSLTFYRSVLGMLVLERYPGGVVLGASAGKAPLLELRELAGAVPVPRGGRLGLYHFAILLPSRLDLSRFVKHLAALGVRAGASDHRVSEALYLQDPDGLGIEVYADRPRSAWQHRDRQLVMTSDPLDLGALAAASGQQAWTGMPGGATVGHVHLHVGDLELAGAFYHEALGLDRVVWSYPGALFLSAGGYHHHLGVNTWAAGALPAGAEDARLMEWEIWLPSAAELERAVESLSVSGNDVERAGDSVLARDPWGTALRLRAA
jgi:catechol 2,3-dioxygenase